MHEWKQRWASVAPAAAIAAALAVPVAAAPASSRAAAPRRAHAVSAAVSPAQIPPSTFPYAQALAPLSGDTLDETFMAGMIPHHEAAIAMAQLELQRGRRPLVQAAAANIVQTQTQQVKDMTTFLRDWYHVTPQQAIEHAPAEARTQIEAMDAAMAQWIQQLKATPAGLGFDGQFMARMLPHHEMSIVEAATSEGRLAHQQLAYMLGTIVHSQQVQVGQMSTWLQTWYAA